MAELRLGNQRLEYVWHGAQTGESPTLVFLHEGLGCVEMWRDFPERLAETTGLNALVFSRAGYGKSSATNGPRSVRFMHDEALRTLPRVLEALEVREAVLIGHSDGGSIALIHAGGQAPDDQTTVIQKSLPKTADPFGSGMRTIIRGLIVEAPHVFVEEISIKSIEELAEEYRNGPIRRQLERYHYNVDDTFREWSDVWLSPDFRSWNIEEYLPRIQVPILLIQGQDDQYGTMDQVKAIERGCQTLVRTVILEACGHDPHFDQPQRTLKEIKKFLEDILEG